MTQPANPHISDKVMSRQVGDETVLLDLASGSYYGLNPVGARVWHLLGEGRTEPEICNTLVSEYEVSPAQAEADLLHILDQLKTHGLVK